jgi:leucyl-tRNA synthetase
LKYDHAKIEKKWQKRWEESQPNAVSEDSKKEKEYLLIEFPYPSGDGLHVGHVRSWTALDVVARKRRAQGKNVLYPIGWDAFGLPTENYAIKTGRNPKDVTKENTDNFRRQIKSVGISFDWTREINTTDPSYYKWTQWLFLKFFEKGLAYKAKTLINWCPKDKIGLANEEVVDGCCERCGTVVEKREKEQWMLAITKYAKRLYDDLDSVDYIERAKIQQRNWIGPSEGAEIEFAVTAGGKIKIFTTRPDTIFGATYLVLSPEHSMLGSLAEVATNEGEILSYAAAAKQKSEIERTAEGKEKSGVEIKGVKAINPANSEEIPIYVADYVLAGYGTGAIMAVPAHDERDFAFAKKLGLPLKYVIHPNTFSVSGINSPETTGRYTSPSKVLDEIIANGTEPLIDKDGDLINSGEFNGVAAEEAKKKITEKVGGKWVTTYKLRDWVFSRQRYWGEPIPMIYCEKDGWAPVPEDQLPVTLPEVEKYLPTDTGESPLSAIEAWVKTTCPKCGGAARRETDVMPNWAGSSWYWLRFTDPKNDKEFASKEKLAYWTPVNWYNGGMEHTVLHLLYSRFWHKFLFDLGLVPTSEPYMKRTSHGLILAEDGSKMSKSKGNTVSPDEIVKTFGADSLRLYEMFVGPFDQPVAWSTKSIMGVRRFLERVTKLTDSVRSEAKLVAEPVDAETLPRIPDSIEILLNQTVKKVGEDIEALKMNTAVSSLMVLLNKLEEEKEVSKEAFAVLIKLLAPFAPHMANELAEMHSIDLSQWPAYDETKLAGSRVVLAVQVNGKVRGSIEVNPAATKEEVLAAVSQNQAIQKWLPEGPLQGGDSGVKVIYVPGKIVSFVISTGA